MCACRWGGCTRPKCVRSRKSSISSTPASTTARICFVPDGDYARFMENFTGKHYPAGDFLDENGKKVGTHNGAVRYTIGQRKGLGLAMGAPVYVCAKDMQANTVTVGPEENLFDRIVYADEVNWIAIPELTADRKSVV